MILVCPLGSLFLIVEFVILEWSEGVALIPNLSEAFAMNVQAVPYRPICTEVVFWGRLGGELLTLVLIGLGGHRVKAVSWSRT